MALRVGHPQFSTAQMSRGLAESGAEPGWRLAALQDVVGRFSGVPAERSLAGVAEDRGLPGGKLDALSKGLDTHQDVWRASANGSISAEVKRLMIEHSDSVLVLRNPKLAPQRTKIPEFLSEVEPASDGDDWPDDELHNW